MSTSRDTLREGSSDTASSVAIPTELEAALVICDPKPWDVVERLAALTRVGEYRLHPRPEKRIHDIYLDTPEMALASKILSLRLREVNGVPKLTLKGESGRGGGNLKARRELEQDWADGALQSVTAELERYGIHLPTSHVVEEAEPLAALWAQGLIVIQERSTRRLLRQVTRDPSPNSEPIADLAFDAVVYHLERDIRHYEIEIELVAGEPAETARQLSASLQAAFSQQVYPWTMPKLTLGMRLQALLRQGRLVGFLTEDGTLLPEAYQVVVGK